MAVVDAPSTPLVAPTAAVGGSPEFMYGDAVDIDDAKKYLSRKKGQVKACYENQLKANPELSGKVELGWTVNPDGSVSGVSVLSNSTGNEDLANCIVRRIKRWRFSESEDEFEIRYPFNFFAQ